MRRASLSAAVLLLVALVPEAATAATTVTRDIKTDTTWTKLGSPYILADHIQVRQEATLTIEPGVVVQGSNYYGLTVVGALEAVGNQLDPIVFTALSERRGWAGLRVLSGGQLTLEHAEVRWARKGVTSVNANPQISNTLFANNQRGLFVVHPQEPLSIADNRFILNKVALYGRSQAPITVETNDFWDNGTSLLIGPKKTYNCGESGDWEIHRNDILHGPDDRFYSFDVRATKGSIDSSMTIDATDNWWGTTDEDEIIGRVTEQYPFVGHNSRKRVDWRPFSDGAHTAWEPPGVVGDPPVEPVGHGDAAYYAFITHPRHGQCLQAEELTTLRGRLSDAMLQARPTPLALKKGNRWWNGRRFVRHPGGPLYFKKVQPGEWTYRFPVELSPGRYSAFHAREWPGLTRVDFTLR